MSHSIVLERANNKGVANTVETLTVTPGDDPKAGYYGSRIRILSVEVAWDASVSSINHKAERLSGLDTTTNTYDVDLVDVDVTGTEWIWYPDGNLILMPRLSASELSDAFKVTIAAGGSDRISYLAIYYEVLE